MSLPTSLNFSINGGKSLSGEITTSRSKNGAVALLAASLLNHGTTTLKNMSRIEEVHRLIEVLSSLGVTAKWSGTTLTLNRPEKLSIKKIDRESAMKTRSILLFIGPLLHELNSFDIPHAGGCALGTRTIRPHMDALATFGVSIETLPNTHHITHSGLHSAELILYESSDTATENALLTAACTEGTSTIAYASANYQVQELCGFLEKLGVKIDGIGSTRLTVTGIQNIEKDIVYSVAEDPIDSMFFIASAITTHSSLTIRRAPIAFLEIELTILKKMGLSFTKTDVGLSENGITHLVDISIKPSELIAFPERIHPRPYPGLNMDNLPFFAVIATQAVGTTMLHDWVYDKRAIYYTELDRLGAQTFLHDPHRISITGPTHLKSAEMICPPVLRAGAMLVAGMLGAEGHSILHNVYTINRGYEDIVKRLQSVGADIDTFE
ncbi:UDP-N-acetylglucosamine 1-carboxyvinyltransferase [hydrothermal vent metagenome]|uniref:UDP-N-acetylglucosamine 1-carboxyvinyltransferase n=1 Tax=hydrothermal vent metagenome TaxID=652676 RepID=A0A3B0UNK5_9ZZZZ